MVHIHSEPMSVSAMLHVPLTFRPQFLGLSVLQTATVPASWRIPEDLHDQDLLLLLE